MFFLHYGQFVCSVIFVFLLVLWLVSKFCGLVVSRAQVIDSNEINSPTC